MASTIPTFTPLKTPIASEGDKSSIVSDPGASSGQGDVVSQKYGIPPIYSQELSSGGKFFQRQDLNGLFNIISQMQYYYQAGGFPTFVDTISSVIGGYPSDAILFYQSGSDSCFVKSRIGNNTRNFNTNPSLITSDGSSSTATHPWLKVTPSINDLLAGGGDGPPVVVVDSLSDPRVAPGWFCFLRG